MAKGTVKRRATPSEKRQKKSRQRVRKHMKAKREKQRPRWDAAIARVYSGEKNTSSAASRKRRRSDADDDEAAAGGASSTSGPDRKKLKKTMSFLSPEELKEREDAEQEVESEIDEEKEERMNKRDPMETQLFLKGLPLDVTEAELKAYFSGHFGAVKRVLLVKSHKSGTLTGSGFLHCGKEGLADAIFNHAQKNARELAAVGREDLKKQTENLSHHQAKRLAHKLRTNTTVAPEPFLEIRGLRFTVMRPMKRTEAQETLSAAEKKKKKRTKVAADDPRHLYLLQEGLITPGSQAAAGLSSSYLSAIEKSYEARKQQLRNTNFFMSTTRLSVRNLPRTLTENDMRRLFAKESRSYLKAHPEDTAREKWGKYGPIKNVKLVRGADGTASGYGFIEFVNHNVALHCLRMLNNNPTVFGNERRLIVAFAVENVEAIQKLQRIKALKQQRAAAATSSRTE